MPVIGSFEAYVFGTNCILFVLNRHNTESKMYVKKEKNM